MKPNYSNPPVASLFRSRLLGAIAVLQLFAADAFSAQNVVLPDQPALSPHELSRMRGGFVTSGGLEIAFSFERLVMVDGRPILSQAISAAALPLTGQARPDAFVHSQLQGLSNLSNGRQPGLATLANGLGMLLQNSVDGRLIQNINLIDMDISGIRQLQQGDIHSRLLPTSLPTLR